MKNQMLMNGLPKLLEEMGELQQVIGKMLNTTGKTYWDGTDLYARFMMEISDVYAALAFVSEKFELDNRIIGEQHHRKLVLYRQWDEDGRRENAR
jgi:hypothetical protein